MSELVDKDAFLKQERKWYCEDCDRRKGVKNGRKCFVYEIGEVPCRACDVDDVLDDLECFETIDAVPVRHGEWVEENRRPRSMQFVCSVCHRTAYDPQPTRDKAWRKRCRYAYCPNCGARMDKSEPPKEEV